MREVTGVRLVVDNGVRSRICCRTAVMWLKEDLEGHRRGLNWSEGGDSVQHLEPDWPDCWVLGSQNCGVGMAGPEDSTAFP